MIGTLALAAVLLGTPTAVADRPSLPTGARPAGPDVPITLELRDASLVDVLEKLADLLGVTPIVEPGVGGQVSLTLRGVPARSALEEVGRAAGVEAVLAGKVLRVRSKAGARRMEAPPAPRTDEAALGELVRFRLLGTEDRAVLVRVPRSAAPVDLPGCRGPVTIARLGLGKEGASALALAHPSAPGERSAGRILGRLDGERRVLLPGCDGRLVVDSAPAASGGEAIDPQPAAAGGGLVATLALLEVDEEREEVLSAPKIGARVGQGWSVRSGSSPGEAGGATRQIDIHGIALEVREEEDAVLMAVHAGVTHRDAAVDGGGTLVARRAESFWLTYGRPLRWTVDSSWNGGRAALVLEVVVERMPARR